MNHVQVYAVPFTEEIEVTPAAFSSTEQTAPLLRINHSPVNAAAAKEYLTSCKWPKGLQDTFLANLSKVPIRFFICDDSGSMNTDDGHRLYSKNGVNKLVSCTRWAELTSALTFHATVAKAANAPTQFRLLNSSVPIMIGDGSDPSGNEFTRLMDLLQESPSGKTPLCVHIREVIRQIEGMAAELRANHQKACVMIASDGESTDGDVAQALKPLEHLPAWVVIRLCTDEEKIVNYWNNIDNDLEVEMDVLDDLEGEAAEIAEVNPWLTYGEPLHRIREFGIPIKEIDLLDEKALNLDQIRLFCSLLLGERLADWPQPSVDRREFTAFLAERQRACGPSWSPLTKRPASWVDVHKLPGGLQRSTGCQLL